jgi:UDP-N-acetylglucosamine:LPS N-acetylglucosamine transferase
MNGFLSPLDRGELKYPFPVHCRFQRIELPARRAYYELAGQPADPRRVLVVCGYWGQGPILRVVRTLLMVDPGLRVWVVCGENARACAQSRQAFRDNPNVQVHGTVPSLLPFLEECACVVTKPGISTLLEAHAAGRKIFLLKGMPVAEDNNARYALRNFGASWFNRDSFANWRNAMA